MSKYISDRLFSQCDKSYREARARIPDADAENTLWQRARLGDTFAMRDLFAISLPTVIKTVMNRRYAMWSGDMDELVAEANLALPSAVADFDPSRGIRFASFYLWKVMERLKDCLRTDALVRTPEYIERVKTVSTSETVHEHDGRPITVEDTLPHNGERVDETMERQELADRIATAISNLPPKHAQVIEEYVEAGFSLKKMDEIRGIKRENYRYYKNAALKKLKETIHTA